MLSNFKSNITDKKGIIEEDLRINTIKNYD